MEGQRLEVRLSPHSNKDDIIVKNRLKGKDTNPTRECQVDSGQTKDGM